MNYPLIGTVCSIWLLAACLQAPAQVSQRVNLRDWGYQPPEGASSRFQRQLSAQFISVGNNAEMAVGFVTRDRTGLATRELPPLSFHVIRFTKFGKFRGQLTIPTSSWNENALFYGSDNSLLVRTGTKLTLLSPGMERIAERDLGVTRDTVRINWKIYPLPSRAGFLLYNYRKSETSIALLNWNNLTPIKECPYSPDDRVLSVTSDDLLSFHPTRARNPLRRVVEGSAICGDSMFSYSWEGGPTAAILLEDNNLLLAGGSSSIRFVVRSEVQWLDTFDKKSEVVSNNVQSTADGHIVAIAVKRFAGGSQFLDISRKLKAVRIIVYEAKNGKRVLEIPVQPTPSAEFDFAIGPMGDVLAIVSDGILQLVSSIGHS